MYVELIFVRERREESCTTSYIFIYIHRIHTHTQYTE